DDMRMERATLIASLVVALSCTAARISEPQPGWPRVDSGESLDDVPREGPLPGVSVLQPPSQEHCYETGPDVASNLVLSCSWGDGEGLWGAGIPARMLGKPVVVFPFPAGFDLSGCIFCLGPGVGESSRWRGGAVCARETFLQEGIAGIRQVCITGCVAIHIGESIDAKIFKEPHGRFVESLKLKPPTGVDGSNWGCMAD